MVRQIAQSFRNDPVRRSILLPAALLAVLLTAIEIWYNVFAPPLPYEGARDGYWLATRLAEMLSVGVLAYLTINRMRAAKPLTVRELGEAVAGLKKKFPQEDALSAQEAPGGELSIPRPLLITGLVISIVAGSLFIVSQAAFLVWPLLIAGVAAWGLQAVWKKLPARRWLATLMAAVVFIIAGAEIYAGYTGEYASGIHALLGILRGREQKPVAKVPALQTLTPTPTFTATSTSTPVVPEAVNLPGFSAEDAARVEASGVEAFDSYAGLLAETVVTLQNSVHEGDSGKFLDWNLIVEGEGTNPDSGLRRVHEVIVDWRTEGNFTKSGKGYEQILAEQIGAGAISPEKAAEMKVPPILMEQAAKSLLEMGLQLQDWFNLHARNGFDRSKLDEGELKRVEELIALASAAQGEYNLNVELYNLSVQKAWPENGGLTLLPELEGFVALLEEVSQPEVIRVTRTPAPRPTVGGYEIELTRVVGTVQASLPTLAPTGTPEPTTIPLRGGPPGCAKGPSNLAYLGIQNSFSVPVIWDIEAYLADWFNPGVPAKVIAFDEGCANLDGSRGAWIVARGGWWVTIHWLFEGMAEGTVFLGFSDPTDPTGLHTEFWLATASGAKVSLIKRFPHPLPTNTTEPTATALPVCAADSGDPTFNNEGGTLRSWADLAAFDGESGRRKLDWAAWYPCEPGKRGVKVFVLLTGSRYSFWFVSEEAPPGIPQGDYFVVKMECSLVGGCETLAVPGKNK